MNMREIIGKSLRRLRQETGLTQAELADQAGLSRVSVVNYESGKALPDSANLLRLSQVFGVTVDSLLRPAQEAGVFKYRSDCSLERRPGVREKMLRWAAEYAALERLFGEPHYTPESVSCRTVRGNKHRIEGAADAFRRRLALGPDEGAGDLFARVEALGLKCLRRSLDVADLFGVSAVNEQDGAFVLVNATTTIERQVFTLAHELGHLIFHRDDFSPGRQATAIREHDSKEKVADYFAGRLLVPAEGLRAALQRRSPSAELLVRLKRRYCVSYSTLIRRIDELRHRKQPELYGRLKAYAKRHGEPVGKRDEPFPLAEEDFPENMRFRGLVLRALGQEKITMAAAASLLDMTIAALRSTWREPIGAART